MRATGVPMDAASAMLATGLPLLIAVRNPGYAHRIAVRSPGYAHRSRARNLALNVLVAFAILPLHLAAQKPSSTCTPLIEGVDSATRVSQLSGAWIDATRLDPSVVDLVPIFAQMRRYELEFRRVDSYEAAFEFRRILRRNSRLACAHYGLGRTLARGPDAFVRLGDGPRDFGPVLYSLAAANAPRELRRALELDSTLVEAATELLRMAGEMRFNENLTETARELPGLVAPSVRDWPPLRIGEANLVWLEGHPDSAVAMLPDPGTSGWSAAEREEAARVLLDADRPESALEWIEPLTKGPAPSSRARYLEARALLVLPGRDADGVAAYMEGLADADSAALEWYIGDIEPLVVGIMARWRAAGPDSLRSNVRWWWERSAALSAVTVGQRLSRHFRRLAEARRRYPLRSSLGGEDPAAVLLNVAWRRFRVDDRGLVLIRQGEPERIVGEDRLGAYNEAFVYPGLHGGNEVHYFTRPGCGVFGGGLCSPNWKLIPLSCGVSRSVREELAQYDPELYRSLIICENPRSNAVLEFNLRARQTATEAFESEGDRRHMDDRPEFAADFYALRGVNGTALTAVIGIDGAGLEAGGLPSDPIYSSRTDLTLADTVRRTIGRARTSDRTRPGHALTTGDAIREYITTEVTPTPRTEYRLVVTDEVNGNSRMAGGPLDIPDFRGDSLMLSGLVIATADSGRWGRGDVALSLLPGRVLPAGQPMHVYFEIYNQPADAAFTVELSFRANQRKGLLGRIAGLFGGKGDAHTLRYDDVARASDPVFGVQQLRSVGTADLEPGEYTLTVTITNLQNGSTTSRSRAVTLQAARGN